MPLQLRIHSLSPLFCKAQIGQGTHPEGGIQGDPLLVNLVSPFKSSPLEYNTQSLVYISLYIFCLLFSISWFSDEMQTRITFKCMGVTTITLTCN